MIASLVLTTKSQPMKTLYAVFFAFFVLSIVSCSDEEEPRSPLIGTWENRNYVDSLELWFVNTYNFRNDSIFDITSTVRETEIGNDLGYRLISTAWYNLESDIFQYYYDDGLFHFGGGEDDPLYVPKKDLKPGIIDFFRIPKGKLTFSNDYSQFTFQEDCWKPNPENEDCFEFPVKTFVRVD